MDQNWLRRAVRVEHFGVNIIHSVIVEGSRNIFLDCGVINRRGVGVTSERGGIGVAGLIVANPVE